MQFRDNGPPGRQQDGSRPDPEDPGQVAWSRLSCQVVAAAVRLLQRYPKDAATASFVVTSLHVLYTKKVDSGPSATKSESAPETRRATGSDPTRRLDSEEVLVSLEQKITTTTISVCYHAFQDTKY